MNGFNNSNWKGPSAQSASGTVGSSSTQARGVGLARLSDDMSDKMFHVKMFVAASSSRNQQAFGSLTIETQFGPLTMNGMTVKKNILKNTESTQMPFKAYPNKREGGRWNVISNEFGESWQTVGPVNYTKFFDNDAAGVAAKLFYEAFRLCSTCANCRDLDKEIVDRIVARMAEIRTSFKEEMPDDDKAKLETELEELAAQLASKNKTCYLDPREDEVTWSTVKEDAEVSIKCSHHELHKLDDSKANISAAATLFNMSAEVPVASVVPDGDELF